MTADNKFVSTKHKKERNKAEMGMSASQARFLGLTARKTNIEFEGQQVNQQRTSLANESANFYNDLLGMKVPVAPSVDDYTKTVYSFEDGALTNEITSMIAQADGKYTVSYLSKWQEDYVPVAASSSIVTELINVDNTQTPPVTTTSYAVGAQELRTLGELDPNIEDPEEQLKVQTEELAWKALLEEKYNSGEACEWFVRYVTSTDTGKTSPYFYKQTDVTDAEYDDNHHSLSNINCYTIGSAQKVEEFKAIQDCKVERDTSGRFISIWIPDGNNVLIEYPLTTQTETDQDAYQDAMNEYEYQKYLYDQAIQDINAKIEIVQAEDKNLELRLKQLDTEQDAVQTEMDAVQKVIEKNVEKTFNTFG